jgi:type II secretory pathway predicted ATPase ExeA
MFESFYGFTDNPFRMSTDVQFLFAHRAYVKALAHLEYALNQGEGFVLITGRPGTGKTTLVRDILSKIDRESLQAISLVSNQLKGEELLRLVALELGFPAQDFNKATLLTRLELFALMLQEKGRRIVIIVDEAQNLSPNGLEELRLLSNLQTDNRPLFQIVLIGQEQLRNLIYGQGRENVQQRIVTNCRLEPLQTGQIKDYVEYRLRLVDWAGDPSIDPEIYPLIYRTTQGVAREINLVMARLLLYGSLEQKHSFNTADLKVVLDELVQEHRLTFDQTALAEEPEKTAVAEAPSEALETADIGQELPEPVLQAEQSPVTSGAEGGELAEQYEVTPNLFGEAEQKQDKAADGAEPFVPIWNEQEEGVTHSETDHTIPLFENDETEPRIAAKDDRDDKLPTMRATEDEEKRVPQGLFTDVNDLLADDREISPRGRTIWRWILYPLVIVILVLVLLVPKPSDFTALWDVFWDQLISDDSGAPEGQNTREIIPLSIDGVDEPDITETAPTARPEESDDSGGQERQTVTEADSLSMDRVAEPDQIETAPTARSEESDDRDRHDRQNAREVDQISRDGVAEPPKAEVASTTREPQQQRVAQINWDKTTGARKPEVDDSEASSRREPSIERTEATTVVATVASINTNKTYFLLFQEPNDSLADQSEEALAKLVVWLHAHPTVRIMITGILTNGEKPLGRMRAALQRAEQISTRLRSAGISSHRIVIEGGRQNGAPPGVGVSVRLVP